MRRVLLLVLVFWTACEKRVAPPPAGLPPLSQAERDRLPTEAAALAPDFGSRTASGPSEVTQAPLDSASALEGELQIDPKMKTRVAAGDTVFLVARGAGPGAAPGPVLAVKRLIAGAFPQRFLLDSRDAMMAGTQLSGEVTLTARVDKDGDAMSRSPGDVTGSLKVKVPNRHVVLTLDTVLGPRDM